MKVILLCAGYATRLYPLTENKPKPLLPVADKPIIQYALEDIQKIDEVDSVYIVTNDKFASHFEEVKASLGCSKPIEIVNDMTISNDDRLGAIGDIAFTIKEKQIDDDILIVAGDNIFDLQLTEFIDFAKKQAPHGTIAAYDVEDIELAKKYGLVKIDASCKIVDFQEKPQNPDTTLASLGLYYYPKSMVPFIQQYIDEGNNTDQPGNFVVWLIANHAAFAYAFNGIWFDIGDFKSLEKADVYFKNKQ